MPSNAPTLAALTCHLVVHGKVQGVYYRQSMIDAARPLALRGWVRNRHDGTVEAVVHGAAAAVQTLLAWARQGPAQARVERVVVTDLAELPADVGPGFAQRDTA